MTYLVKYKILLSIWIAVHSLLIISNINDMLRGIVLLGGIGLIINIAGILVCGYTIHSVNKSIKMSSKLANKLDI